MSKSGAPGKTHPPTTPGKTRLPAAPARPKPVMRYVPRPRVDARHLETVVPRARVSTLSLWTGADAVSVRLAVLPAAAVRAAVVEVEPAAVDQRPVGAGGGRAGGRRGRGRVVTVGQRLLQVCSVSGCRCLSGRTRRFHHVDDRTMIPRSHRKSPTGFTDGTGWLRVLHGKIDAIGSVGRCLDPDRLI